MPPVFEIKSKVRTPCCKEASSSNSLGLSIVDFGVPRFMHLENGTEHANERQDSDICQSSSPETGREVAIDNCYTENKHGEQTMLRLSGYVVANESNQLISMALTEDIDQGININNPVPVFASVSDAKDVWKSWCLTHCGDKVGKIYKVSTSGLQPVQDLKYTEDANDSDEDEDFDDE